MSTAIKSKKDSKSERCPYRTQDKHVALKLILLTNNAKWFSQESNVGPPLSKVNLGCAVHHTTEPMAVAA